MKNKFVNATVVSLFGLCMTLGCTTNQTNASNIETASLPSYPVAGISNELMKMSDFTSYEGKVYVTNVYTVTSSNTEEKVNKKETVNKKKEKEKKNKKVEKTKDELESTTEEVELNFNVFDIDESEKWTTAELNIRETPNIEGILIAKLNPNEKITVNGKSEDDKWYRIKYNNNEYYVSSAYVSDTKPVPQTEIITDVTINPVDTQNNTATDTNTNSTDYVNVDDMIVDNGVNVSAQMENPVTTKLTPTAGKVSGPSGNETYYNLDMSNIVQRLKNMGYEGDYWVRDDGCKMFGDYILVAADFSIRPIGTLVQTSLGMGIVADTGGFVKYDSTRLDIATTW